MSKLIVLASIGVLFSTVTALMESKGFNPVNDLSNFNDLKPEYIPDNSYLAVAVRNKEGNYPDIHKLALTESFAPLNLNVFSQEYIKKAMPNQDIQIFEGDRFGIAVISNKIAKKEIQSKEEAKKETLPPKEDPPPKEQKDNKK